MLIVYNGDTGLSLGQTLAYEGFQTVLNYFGLVAVAADAASRPLPDDAAMSGVRAVIVSFNATGLADAPAFHEWLHRQMDQGRKLVVLGPLDSGGRADNPGTSERYLELYARLGVRYEAGTFLDRSRLRFAKLDKSMTGYERPFPANPSLYELLVPLRPDVEVHVSVERTDRPRSESAAVFTSSAGGLVLSAEYAYWQDPITYKQKWHIDPFAFMAKALALPVYPVPDPTTLNGRRVAFSHVDADGFAGVNQMDRSKVCAEILADEVLSKVDFPVSYSLIEAETSPDWHGSERLLDVARRILALPNVEPASHTFSHPYFWNAESSQKDRYDDRFAFDIPGYSFDADREIVQSVRFVSSLSPPEKPCRLLFWSGACEPLAEHQRMVRDNGLLAINGGDTLWDAANDSLFGVKPLHRHLGEDQHQIHIGQANDNIPTNLWRGPFNGYRNIIETMRRTGSPRRLKPIDIYYHTFSAEKVAGLAALKEVYAWVMEQPVAPVFTSRYVQSMEDWLKVRVLDAGPGRFAVEDYGQCLTVRLPSGGPAPALSRCENVLGYDRQPQGLYVHLAPGARRAVVAFEDEERGKERPYLKDASGVVSGFKASVRSVEMETRFHTKSGRLTLAGFEPGAMVRVRGAAVQERELVRAAGVDGTVLLEGLSSGTLEVSSP
ncbi:MAG: polysaccharide deacetylase family protein [Thermodesulfobacteriota bacterium]